MIWSPYAIRRSVYAFNKYSNRTAFDRMVCALNEAARIQGLKTPDDELINELNEQIILYEVELQKTKAFYEKKLDAMNEEVKLIKARELERIKYESKKIKELKRDRSAAVSILSQVHQLIYNGFTVRDMRNKQTVFTRLAQVVGSDVKSVLTAIKIEDENEQTHEN